MRVECARFLRALTARSGGPRIERSVAWPAEIRSREASSHPRCTERREETEIEVALERAKKRIAGYRNWYHRIEVAPGVVTAGVHDSATELGHLDAMALPGDCAGRRVLDIGCRDGFFAFEMERRGGEVIGIDYADPAVTGFAIASEVLESRVEYRVDNVYDLSRDRYGSFDVVLFLGVLYHLRNPMLALDRIRSVQQEGGLLFVETQLATAELVEGSDAPLWQFFPGKSFHGDATNKWAPNLAGLRAVLPECGYEVLETARHETRGYARCRAVVDPEVRYFQRLDSSKGIWGRQAADTERTD